MAGSAEGQLARGRAVSIQTYARIAGALILVTTVSGFFGEAYVPSRIIVSGDAAATAGNLTTLNFLFRLGFASYLVEALCDIALALIFYVLLRPVQKDLALLSAFFGLVGTGFYAVAELIGFVATLAVGHTEAFKAFSPDQLHDLVLLSLKVFGLGAGTSFVFYGVASVLRGYLIFRSGYFPRLLGALLMLAGLGFITKTFTVVLTPAYSSNALLLPMFLAGVLLMVWLLVRGVNISKWEQRVAARSV